MKLLHRLRLYFACSLLCLGISSCGGGSGASLVGSGGDSGGGSGGGSSGGGQAVAAPEVRVLLRDSGGQSTTTLGAGESLSVEATVLSAEDVPLAGQVVTFSTEGSLATFSPASGTALTNSSGVAKIQMQSAGILSAGAGIVTAQTSITEGTSTTQVSGFATYTVGQANVTISALSFPPPATNTIPAYGTTTVQLTVLVDGAPTKQPTPVQFTSGCTATGKASISASVQTINGIASATYKDLGCGGNDTVTASAYGQSTTAVITTSAPKAANIQFVSATPELIAIRGTAGLPDVAQVVFRVVDAAGNAVAAKNVTMDLNTRSGGVLLDGKASGTVTKQSGADGTVSVSIQSGTNPTSVWVLATLTDGTVSVSTQSNKLIISTGLPTQDRFSLSANVHSIEGWEYDGVEATINVFAADRVGNYVPDGTTVNFVTEGAAVGGDCQLVDGACTVKFRSQEGRPRFSNSVRPSPTLYAGFPPFPVPEAGRVTLLAYANGEESFSDTNGNNVLDSGEAYREIGDVFVDNNEDSVWDASEAFVPFAANSGVCPTPPPDGAYYNALSKALTCDGVFGQAHVRRSLIMVLSGSEIEFAYPVSSNASQASPGVGTIDLNMDASCVADFSIRLSDENFNPLPAGTKLSVPSALSTTTYLNDTGETVKAAIVMINDEVLDSTEPGGTTHRIRIVADKCAPVSAGIPVGDFVLQAETPKGKASSISLNVVNN